METFVRKFHISAFYFVKSIGYGVVYTTVNISLLILYYFINH